ncbi:CG3517 [Drosophila busckii]|uniref:CG3517 n=1 Tax=Drosophila busckii TaxID=30019 RepID=A0A0M3QY37_DROBS|nr:uncharacterized protein LOC108604286 [Drosophila busckii]ALC46993.1 CG3517 [Drosophila busckii]
MQAHHAMPDFRCRNNCQHKECQRHAPLGVIDQHTQCKCLGEVNASSIFLENVLDLANSLAQIMIICGLHECKAKSTVDIITYAFLHYDQVCYCIDTEPKKRLRKEDLFHELGKKSLMNKVEAHLAYSIIKRGFKAFYYEPKQELTYDEQGRPSYNDECVWVHAARKTAESYARFDGLSCPEQLAAEAKVKIAYKKFYDRMQTRKRQPEGDDCNCCFCAKKRGHLVYAKEPAPCSSKRKPKHVCPYCCKKKQKQQYTHPARQPAKCPKCHKSRKFCCCAKMDFNLQWVKSIWERPDFNQYYKNEIAEIEQRLLQGSCWLPPEPVAQELVDECEEEEEDELSPEAQLALAGKTAPSPPKNEEEEAPLSDAKGEEE